MEEEFCVYRRYVGFLSMTFSKREMANMTTSSVFPGIFDIFRFFSAVFSSKERRKFCVNKKRH